jgi:tight adherence protein B
MYHNYYIYSVLFILFIFMQIYLARLIANPEKSISKARINLIKIRLNQPNRQHNTDTASKLRRSRNDIKFLGIFSALERYAPKMIVLRNKYEKVRININISYFFILVFIIILFLAVIIYNMVELTLWQSCLISIIVVYCSCRQLFSIRTRRIAQQFLSRFPDVLDLMVRNVKSGLPIAEAIHSVGQEANGVIGDVFKQISASIKLGLTLDEALWSAAQRLELQEFKFFVVSVSIQQETGGNLAEILSNLASMMRRREQLKLKIRAMSSEARASALIIGSLPFIMFAIIMFINPDYMMTFFIDPRGHVLLAIGACSLLLGGLVMSKMVSFEI